METKQCECLQRLERVLIQEQTDDDYGVSFGAFLAVVRAALNAGPSDSEARVASSTVRLPMESGGSAYDYSDLTRHTVVANTELARLRAIDKWAQKVARPTLDEYIEDFQKPGHGMLSVRGLIRARAALAKVQS